MNALAWLVRCRQGRFMVPLVAGGIVFAAAAGCGQKEIAAQKTFASAENAADTLGMAYQAEDRSAAAALLGDAGQRLVVSGDPVIDRDERQWFLALFQEKHEVILEGESRAVLKLGDDGQPYPIPIIRGQDNRWRFDATEGHEDLLSRRMSKTELIALDIVLAYVDAQREYHREDRNGDGVLEYAQKFRSSPGKQDGLVWTTEADMVPSPVATLTAIMREEGYGPATEGQLPIYRGYYYRIVTGQGPHAPGGDRDYVVDGRMTGGFALVAFPVRYSISGIMTFMTNQDGVVYQKDLGPETVHLGRTVASFDPDRSWGKGVLN